MPKREDIKKILVIGSGPIIIGQAAEFDYSGTQAVQSLKEEGYEVVLINSNPATIMTDKEIADQVYLEPLSLEFLQKIIAKENPDAILPTLGGQTGLNLAAQLAETDFFKSQNIELLGCNLETIKKAEDRDLFKNLMQEIEEPIPPSAIVQTQQEALEFAKEIGYPLIIRPAYTLGGTGGGMAANESDLLEIVASGLRASPITQCLVEKSIAGFKELEYEVVRDAKGNTIIICNMENIDPVGVHTGDSIVVAPSLTLTDREHQMLRSSAIKIIEALDIKGGCNIQFALSPTDERYYIIEVNPRVSRSSALASKATGYPIAKISAKIAVGLSLDEIKNPVTLKTYACFEPSLDYVVVKIPRWPFDKFQKANRTLSTQMKATGEVMSMGRSFEEAFLKAVRSLEIGKDHLWTQKRNIDPQSLARPHDERIFELAQALREGVSIDQIYQITMIDPYFLRGFQNIIQWEKKIQEGELNEDLLRKSKALGFTDKTIAKLSQTSTESIRALREKYHLFPTYKLVDTCAGEFEAQTPYYYSSYDQEDEMTYSERKKVIVIGSGPIRIGQGVEFDYAGVHAIQAIRELGYEAIMINNNPETVSTDFSISDRLYFEPLYAEDVIHILEKEKPEGVIVQFGGQTAINLAQAIHDAGFKLLGTDLESLDRAEDREKFEELLTSLDIARPMGTIAYSKEEALQKAKSLGFPVMVRPSYVLGGRAMEIVYNDDELQTYMSEAVEVNPGQPVLIDRYMIGTEVEVDALCDAQEVLIPGIMEHIEKAGVHSGDSIAVYPSQNLAIELKQRLVNITHKIATSLGIKGVLNIQFVIYKGEAFVLEVNPRASRTLPFLSKVTNIPMAKVATQIILGASLKQLGFAPGLAPEPQLIHIKAPVFSFAKLTDVDTALGPEMKSTGEVMGSDYLYAKALYKALIASGYNIPSSGSALLTLSDNTKEEALPIIKRLSNLGFNFLATEGTAHFLRNHQISVKLVNKISQGSPHIIDIVQENNVQIVINTMSKGKNVESDGFALRRATVEKGIIGLTSLDTAKALVEAIEIHSFCIYQLG